MGSGRTRSASASLPRGGTGISTASSSGRRGTAATASLPRGGTGISTLIRAVGVQVHVLTASLPRGGTGISTPAWRPSPGRRRSCVPPSRRDGNLNEVVFTLGTNILNCVPPSRRDGNLNQEWEIIRPLLGTASLPRGGTGISTPGPREGDGLLRLRPSLAEGRESQHPYSTPRRSHAPCVPPSRRDGNLNLGTRPSSSASPSACVPPSRRDGNLNSCDVANRCAVHTASLPRGGTGISTLGSWLLALGSWLCTLRPSLAEGRESQRPRPADRHLLGPCVPPSRRDGNLNVPFRGELHPGVHCVPPSRRDGNLNWQVRRIHRRWSSAASLPRGGTGISTTRQPVTVVVVSVLRPSLAEGRESQRLIHCGATGNGELRPSLAEGRESQPARDSE